MKNLELKNLIDKLTALYFTKGVQPSELADAIFEDPYTEIKLFKNEHGIQLLVTFKEKCELSEKQFFHIMKYTYDNKGFLISIEEAVNSNDFKVNWDRSTSIDQLITDITNNLLQAGYSDQKLEQVLLTLPAHDFQIKISEKLLKLAS